MKVEVAVASDANFCCRFSLFCWQAQALLLCPLVDMRSSQGAVLVVAGITGLTGALWAVKRLLNRKESTYDDLDSECSELMFWVKPHTAQLSMPWYAKSTGTNPSLPHRCGVFLCSACGRHASVREQGS